MDLLNVKSIFLKDNKLEIYFNLKTPGSVSR